MLRDVSFEVCRGDCLCVVGENGTGKSTLMQALLRLKKPAAGQIRFDESIRRNEIGYLPQRQTSRRDFPASVGEVVLSGRLNRRGFRPFYTRADRAAAAESMCLMEIGELSSRPFSQLSGGQQQRTLLARALCATEKLLLLDEPVAGLDPLAAEDFYGIIRRLNRENGLTIVMVSHDLKGALPDASHVLHLKDGRAFHATAEQYAKSEIGRFFLREAI